MTSSSDRLDRIEAILASVAESNAASNERMNRLETNLERTEAVTASNARAIGAWSSRIEEGIAEAEEVSTAMSANTNRRMEEAISDTVELVSNLANQFDQDRQRFDQLHSEHNQRFNNLLEDARADREQSNRRYQEWQQKYEEQLAEARADREEARQQREANAAEHRAFTQNIQVLLAEISRLWQRLAG